MAAPRFLGLLARWRYGLLALVCVALWLPGLLSLPALDRDESRFAQSSRQMLDSGNYVDIRFGHVPRYKKPVGIYWLQAAATAAAGLGDHSRIWTYRLPSLLGGLIAVWLTAWCGAVFSAEAGLLAGLLMAASILLTAEASIATTDAALLAATLGMQGVLLRVYRAAREGLAMPATGAVLAGWAAMAIGILLKGPVAPGVAAATLLALCVWDWRAHRPGEVEAGSPSGRATHQTWRWMAALKPALGVLVTLLLVAPWLVAISLESHGAFLQQSLGGDFASKVAGGQESHGAPPGYFLILSALTFWPAILFILPGIGLGVSRRAEPAVRFLLAWAGAWWVVVELVPTKLPHYVLPSYPALAILAALWLLTPGVAARGWRVWLARIAPLQFLIGLLLLAAAPFALIYQYGGGAPGIPVLVAEGVAAACGLAALGLYLFRKTLWALLPALLAAAILIPTLTAATAPALDQLWLSRHAAALVARYREAGDPPPMLAGYEEPSLVFALGADTVLSDGRGAAELGANAGGLALVQDDEKPAFLARLAELEAGAAALGDLSGMNYSRGRAVHITLYRIAPAHPVTMPIVH
jgi:4-amino-4-deoxy-L-arabinose transferase-like glycosyltransferase